MPPKQKKKNVSDELIPTPPIGRGQADAILRIAEAHKNMVDLLDNELPSGDLRDRVMQAQQESFLFAEMQISINPKSFPDPKPGIVFDEPDADDEFSPDPDPDDTDEPQDED